MTEESPVSNGLKPVNKSLPAVNNTYNVDSKGDNNQIVAHAEKVEQTVQVFLPMSRGQDGGRRGGILCTLDLSHYQLFVVDGDAFRSTTGTFTVPKELALTDSITDDLKDKYSRLTHDAIEKIKTFPAIFASLNKDFGSTESEHMAAYGVVTDVSIQPNVIEISYHILQDIPQQVLNENMRILGIAGVAHYNELNDPHWTIKKVNIIDALKPVGVGLLAIS